jgi:vitamin B12 transporter
MFSRQPIALAVVALHAPLFALAQAHATSPFTASALGEVVVTGSRFPEPAATAVRPVQVISAEDIRASGAASLTELLATLGGMETVSSGGPGQPAGVFIRGANSAQTVVLVDGVRIGSATLGTVPLESLPLALIDHVEVLPGASSSLYGADAIGGVIQIFTRSAGRTPQASVAVTVGEQGLKQLAATYARRMGDTDVSLGANVLSTTGINATTPGINAGSPSNWAYNADRDGYLNRGAQARLAHRLGGGHTVDVQWLRSDNKVHYDDGSAGDTYNVNRTQTLAAHWAGPLAATVQSELRLARSWDEATAVSSFPGYINTQQDQASWLNRINLGVGTLTAGAEWLEQTVRSDTAYDVSARHTLSGLLGWRATYGALSLQTDLRHDNNSQYGGATTAQLGAAWQVDPTLRLRGSAGSAFKAPSFNEQFYPGFGNPLLKPERANSYELGADAKLGPVDLNATLFDNRMRDLIDYAAPTYTPVNVAHAETRGLSLAASSEWAGTRGRLSLTLQSPENTDNGMQLRRRARQFAALHLTHRLGAVNLGTDLNWVAQRYDSPDQAADSRMGGYGLVAVFAAWQFAPEWALEGRANNLGDKAYTQAQGYATPGRQAQMTLRWTPAL